MKYGKNIGDSFYLISKEFSSNTALRFANGKEYSYAEFNSFSNCLANFLISKHLSKEDVVAIFNNKSFFSYSLMLACLKTGIIYTNLDPTNPWQRINKILGTCKPAAIFYENTGEEFILNIGQGYPDIQLFDMDDTSLQTTISECSNENLALTNDISGNNPAYIMFTSGSTGFPKGAVMSHENIQNFIKWGQQTFDVTPTDVFTNANPVYFDNSVFDFYISIFSGATLVPLDSEIVKNPQKLVSAVNDSKCTIWFSVPSLLVYLLTTKALTKEDFPTIKRISFGGEGFAKSRLKQLYDMFAHRMKLYNVYGPTECTCICSSYIIRDEDFENMTDLAPLGNIAFTFGYTLFPIEGLSTPNMGELALSGPCVGLGYYNDLERTTKSFIEKNNERFYKTGDLVLQGENGYLYFKGRIDNQIKHMGYRIELEEIESAFNSLNYINETGVVYEKITADMGQIKAYVSVNSKLVSSSEILSDVKKILPQYMLPKSIKILDILPKNRNGKIDRKQLLEMK